MRAGSRRDEIKLKYAQKDAQRHLAFAIVKLGEGKSPEAEFKAFEAAALKISFGSGKGLSGTDVIQQALLSMNSEIKNKPGHLEKSINLLEKLAPTKVQFALDGLSTAAPSDGTGVNSLKSDFERITKFAETIRQTAVQQFAEDFPDLNGKLANLDNVQLDQAATVLAEYPLETQSSQVKQWKAFAPAFGGFVRSLKSGEDLVGKFEALAKSIKDENLNPTYSIRIGMAVLAERYDCQELEEILPLVAKFKAPNTTAKDDLRAWYLLDKIKSALQHEINMKSI
ncbi:MAG: hypothetical protein JWQ23_4282 [Herminiimonas sp.]|nr:hypothetical protein [Herminiimonas sp.]